MKTQYDLFQIDETRGEDKTGENTDNTLIRYFFPDENKPGNRIQNFNPQFQKITALKIEKTLRKPIKLRNSLKQCYWDRHCSDIQNINSQDHYIIRVEQMMPKLNFTRQIQIEIENYILNDFYDVYNGKLKSSVNHQNKIINYTGIDVISSESACRNFNDQNLILNPKIVANKNEIKNSILNIFKNIYMKIQNLKEIDMEDENTKILSEEDSHLPGLFNFYFNFRREKSSDNSYKVIGKIYCVFPNLNLELKRINKIPISRSILSKFLASGGRFDKLETSEADQLKNSYVRNGFIAMSSKHRLITLPQNSESMKEILFGIWLNLSEEKVNKSNVNEETFTRILNKYSCEIYEKCLNFLIKSKKIEVINSPSPDEGIFLMCLFLNGAQLFYEVKILPNEKEKYFRDREFGTFTQLSNFSNEWLIIKNKFKIENNLNPRMTSRNQFYVKNENTQINIDFSNIKNIRTVRDFLSKNFTLNDKEQIRSSKQTNNSDNSKTITANKTGKLINPDKNKISTTNYKDPLNELFEEDNDKQYTKYDFPLSVVTKTNRNPSVNLLNPNSNNSKKVGAIPPKGNNKATKNISSTTRNNPIDSESLLRENLLTRNLSNSSLNKRNNNKEEINSAKPQEKTNNNNSSQTLTITNTSKGLFDQLSIQNTQNKPISSYHRQAQQEPLYNSTENNININHKKQLSNDIGYYTAQNFFQNKLTAFDINNNQINVGKSYQIEKIQSNMLNLNYKPNFDPISHKNTGSNIENAYEIIYDQAKSIQILQEQIIKLQTELKFVVDKLKNQEEKDKNSFICSCGGKKSSGKQNVISTGTNTSNEGQILNNGLNNFQFDINNNPSNSNSLKSNNNFNVNNASRPSIKNFNNDLENTTNILASPNVQTFDDMRYENFLNENSINFPRQFLDIDLKHYDSASKELENIQLNQNVNNSSSNNILNVIDKNFKIANNKSGINNSNSNTNNCVNNQVENEMRNININTNFNDDRDKNRENYLRDGSQHLDLNHLSKEKEKLKTSSAFFTDQPNNNCKNNLNILNNILPTETSNFMQNNSNLRLNFNNVDVTTTSIDPPSYRYFLKVPSMHYKSNLSMHEDHGNDNHMYKKSLDTTRGNDYTINLPKIIFNESIESFEENDAE